MKALAMFDTSEQDAVEAFCERFGGDWTVRCSEDGHNFFYITWYGPLPPVAALSSQGYYHDTYTVSWSGGQQQLLAPWPEGKPGAQFPEGYTPDPPPDVYRAIPWEQRIW